MMKPLRMLVLAGIIVMSCVPALWAFTGTGEIGVAESYFEYKEDGMKETGAFTSIDGAYTWHNRSPEQKSPGVMFKVDGRLGLGNVYYDGQLQDGTPYEIDNILDIISDIRATGGYDLTVFQSTRLTPYIGIGYRFLFDDASTDPAGYRRFSNYLYSPLGFETETDLGNGWLIGLTGEFDLFWHGWQVSYLSDAVSSLNDVTNEQREGYGFRASVRIIKKTSGTDLIIEPYVRYWKIEDSETSEVTFSGDIIGEAIEPKNHSTEIGLKIGTRF